MRSFWSDPYLWIHVAGAAALPIALEVCLLGLAVGDPFLPSWLELFLVAAAGIAPVFWMQWQRPFYIFSLLVVALKPAQLTEQQRRLLQFFKTPEVRLLTVIVPVVLTIILWQLYQLSPIAAEAASFLPQSRILGLLIAAIAFLGSNLFLQVPVSVLRVLLTNDAKVAATEPYPLEKISQDFTLLGLQVKQIVPPLVAQAAPTPVPPMPVSTPPATPEPVASAEAEVVTNPVASVPDLATPEAAEPASTEPSVGSAPEIPEDFSSSSGTV